MQPQASVFPSTRSTEVRVWECWKALSQARGSPQLQKDQASRSRLPAPRSSASGASRLPIKPIMAASQAHQGCPSSRRCKTGAAEPSRALRQTRARPAGQQLRGRRPPGLAGRQARQIGLPQMPITLHLPHLPPVPPLQQVALPSALL